MTNPWDDLATHRQKQFQRYYLHLTKGVQVNPKAYCCGDNTINDQKPPVAILTVTPNPAQAGDNVTLDLSASYDPDGVGIAAWHIWDGQGNNQAGAVWVQNYANPGMFEVIGVVTDADGFEGQASVWLEVLAGGDPEVPDLTGKKVIIGTLAQGVYVTADIFAAPTVWVLLSGGLAGAALIVNGLVRDPWDSSNTALIFTDDGIYRNTDIPGAANWVQTLTNAQIDTLTGEVNCYVHDLKGSICQEGLFFAIVGPANGNHTRYCLRSINGGVTWFLRGQLVGTCAFNPTWVGLDKSSAMAASSRRGNLYVSSHDANKLWAFCSTCHGAANGRSTLFHSPDQGATWNIVSEATSGLGLISSGMVPYHNNALDQRMYCSGWGVLGIEQKSITGGASWVAIAPPGIVAFKGMLGEHTWNDQLVRAIMGIAGANSTLSISQDQASSWGAAIALNFPVWAAAGFPYDDQLMYFGRATAPALGNFPVDPVAPLIKTTSDGGGTLVDRSGNLRAAFNVKCITAIVPDWLEDE